MYKVLGFTQNYTIPGGSSGISTNPIDLTGGVGEIEVRCNLVDSQFCRSGNKRASILYTATPHGGEPHSKINLVDTDHYYLPITNTDMIKDVEIKLVNQSGATIRLNDLPTQLSSEFVLGIRKVSNI
jgi:hypothetical protein